MEWISLRASRRNQPTCAFALDLCLSPVREKPSIAQAPQFVGLCHGCCRKWMQTLSYLAPTQSSIFIRCVVDVISSSPTNRRNSMLSSPLFSKGRNWGSGFSAAQEHQLSVGLGLPSPVPVSPKPAFSACIGSNCGALVFQCVPRLAKFMAHGRPSGKMCCLPSVSL